MINGYLKNDGGSVKKYREENYIKIALSCTLRAL